MYFVVVAVDFFKGEQMFKQIALACALVVTTSFASWDLFPVLENHKGETRVGIEFYDQGETQSLHPYVGSRYTVLPNLELAATLPYLVELNSNDNGLGNPTAMVRYQFLENLNAFVDVTIPTTYGYYTNSAWAFFFGAQYSQKFGIVNLGSQLGMRIETQGKDKISPPLLLNGVIETAFEFGSPIIPLINVAATMEIGEYSYDGENYGDNHTGHGNVSPGAGATFVINQTFSIRALGRIAFGRHTGDDLPIGVFLRLNMFL